MSRESTESDSKGGRRAESDGPGEFFECEHCTEMRPVRGSKSVCVFVHRVEGRPVGRDMEQHCAACLGADEDFKEPDDDYDPDFDHRYYEEK